jgi:hypothetical protein
MAAAGFRDAGDFHRFGLSALSHCARDHLHAALVVLDRAAFDVLHRRPAFRTMTVSSW